MRLLTNLAKLYHQSFGNAITVYSLEVDQVNEFYAAGILVHNCPICSALGGVSWGEDGVIPTSIAGQEENAVSTAIGQPFVHPGGNGKQGKYEGQKYEMPPAHPRCRCWISPEG